MPIDIYQGRSLLLSISEDAFLRLDDALTELRDRAGRSVDPYGTSSLEPAHAQLWLTGLRRIVANLSDEVRAQTACVRLIEVLEESAASGSTLTVEGD